MKIRTIKLLPQTAGFCDIIDITAKIQEQIDQEKIQHGLATIFVSGSTAALTIIENERGLIQDLKEFVEKLIPSEQKYHHDERRGDNNGFSHLRAALFGPSLALPIEPSSAYRHLATGVLLDFDNRPRTREIVVQLIGEST